MKCPYCGNRCPEGDLYCSECKQPLPTTDETPSKKKRPPRSTFHKCFVAFCWLACFVALAIGIYKLVFWIDSYEITRLYTRGVYKPTLNEIYLDDGQLAHALVFYGEDGDQIYLPEMDKSLSICGGVARLEIADSEWFGSDVSDYDYADIRFNPVLIREDGTEVQLPTVEYTVEAPVSPITVTSPAENNISIVTSVYPIDLQVVPGSSVFLNGENLTSSVDRSGSLSVDVSVEPIGDNIYTVIVRTPHHKETRQDIVIHRQKYDIEIELDTTVGTTSSSQTMTVSGQCEPGAMISVDTAYLEESLSVDMSTGRFSFVTKFSHYGDNVVRFRATMDGRSDAVISFTVNYTPTLAQYSAAAWRMDYSGLSKYLEQWTGQVFKCTGKIVDIITENNSTYLVMDVGTDGTQQLLILQNVSKTTASMGPTYVAYADVSGRYLYKTSYYPLLVARYIDYAATD